MFIVQGFPAHKILIKVQKDAQISKKRKFSVSDLQKVRNCFEN